MRKYCSMHVTYTGQDGHTRVVWVERDDRTQEYVVYRKITRRKVSLPAEIFRSRNLTYIRKMPEEDIPIVIEEVGDEFEMWCVALNRWMNQNFTRDRNTTKYLPLSFTNIAELLSYSGMCRQYPYLSKPVMSRSTTHAVVLTGETVKDWARNLMAKVDAVEEAAREHTMDKSPDAMERLYDNLKGVVAPMGDPQEEILLLM